MQEVVQDVVSAGLGKVYQAHVVGFWIDQDVFQVEVAVHSRDFNVTRLDQAVLQGVQGIWQGSAVGQGERAARHITLQQAMTGGRDHADKVHDLVDPVCLCRL